MIKPTIGRVVHFFQSTAFSEPRAAIICYVHSDRLVNLVTFNANGEPVPATSVQLVQEGEAPGPGHYCEWMPYQKGQAARAEELEARLLAK